MPVLPSSSRFRIALTMLSSFGRSDLARLQQGGSHFANDPFLVVRLQIGPNRLAADKVRKLHSR